MLVGHQGVTKALSSQLPPVSIISGPPSVGKRIIAAQAAINNNISRIDFTEVSRLTASEATRVKAFMSSTPMNTYKFALIDLDNATHNAFNKLLKALEEPPDYARFTLITSQRVPPTILTRGYSYSVGLLEESELLQILLNKGVPASEAPKFSKLGRVDLALQAYSDVAARAAAINVLQSVESNDYLLFMQAFKAVDEKTAHTIITILQESAAQNWKLFTPDYIGSFSNQKLALAVLSAWSNVSGARPQLAVRVALESIMKG